MIAGMDLCPFCGGAPKFSMRTLDERFAYANEGDCTCEDCGARVQYRPPEPPPGEYADNSGVMQKTKAKWNQRFRSTKKEPS